MSEKWGTVKRHRKDKRKKKRKRTFDDLAVGLEGRAQGLVIDGPGERTDKELCTHSFFVDRTRPRVTSERSRKKREKRRKSGGVRNLALPFLPFYCFFFPLVFFPSRSQVCARQGTDDEGLGLVVLLGVEE